MNSVPFIHMFENVAGKFFYDVNKNMVIEVNENMYDALYKWVYYGCNVEKQMTDASVRIAIQELESKGFLSSNRPQEIKHPLSMWARDYLENNLKRLVLQVTQNCNMRCQYCNFSGDGILSRTHQYKNMSKEIALRSIDFLYTHSRKSREIEISFYGGEPLLFFPIIKEAAEYAIKIFGDKKIKFSMTTNGTMFSEEMMSFLSEKKFALTISVDGPAEYHDVNRRMAVDGSGSFSKIYNNLVRIKKIYSQYYNTIEFNAVIEPDRDLKEIEDFFNSDYVFKDNHVIVNRVNDSLINEKYEDTEEHIVDKEAMLFRSLVEQIVFGRTKYYSRNIDIMNMLKYTMRPMESIPFSTHHQGPCIPGYNRLFIDINGVFRICEKASELSEHMIIGDLNRGFDYKQINNLLNIGIMTEKKCKDCWLIRQCRICPTAIDNITELSKGMKEKQCLLQQKTFIDKLNDYVIFKKIGLL